MWQMTVIRCHGRSFHASPHRRTEEGIQGLWDLVITSVSTWLKHLRKYGLLESVDGNGTYTKLDKRWGMISDGGWVVGIHTLIIRARVCEAKGTVNLCTKCTNLTITKPYLNSAKMNLNFTSLNLSSATLNLSFRFSNLSFTLPILSFKVLPVLFPASVYAHITRTYIYNVFPSTCLLTSFKTYVLQHAYQSTSYKIVLKNQWKNDRYIWSEWIYPVLLHPLSKRRKALKLTFWQKRILNSSKFLFFCSYSNQE